MPKVISLTEAADLGGSLANVEENTTVIATITDVEKRSGTSRRSGNSYNYFICSTDCEVMGSPMRVLISEVGAKVALVAKKGLGDRVVKGREAICWVTWGDVQNDGNQYLSLFPKGHPNFGKSNERQQYEPEANTMSLGTLSADENDE